MMKSYRPILYKQKRVILTIADGVSSLVCAVNLRYTLPKYFGGIKTKFIWGRAKGRGMGEKPKMRVTFENSHYSARYKLYLTNC